LVSSRVRFTQAVPQRVVPAAQGTMQRPEVQMEPVAQAFPHAPQLSVSVLRSVHARPLEHPSGPIAGPQGVRPAPHAFEQAPAEQTVPAQQRAPHAPQFAGSLLSETQVSPQRVEPVAHARSGATSMGGVTSIGGGVSAGGGVTSAGGGVVSAGGGVTSAGGGVVSAGGGVTSAGGGVVSAGGGVTSAGGGVVSAGGGVTSAGGGDVSAGGGDVSAGASFVDASDSVAGGVLLLHAASTSAKRATESRGDRMARWSREPSDDTTAMITSAVSRRRDARV
jgi:hypothetical protein